jgi:hypothetical protein
LSISERQLPATATPDQPESKRSFADRLPAPLRRLDRGILALVIVFVLTLPLFTPRIYASDEIKYFSYLPSILFDRDVDFTNNYTYFYQLNPEKQAALKEGVIEKLNERGLPVNEGPVGSALLWSPFYLTAHGISSLGNALGIKSLKPDGYSQPYIFAVSFGSLLYAFAGLIFSYLFAANFVPRFYAAFATIVIWLGSGVIFYMSLTPPMSHANSLFMLSLWLWLWYKTREWRFEADGTFVPGVRRGSMWLLLGVLGGIATMVREQDGVIMIIAALEALFLYWHYTFGKNGNFNAHRPAILKLFGRNLLLLIGFGLSILPQLIIYLALNGRIGPGKTVGDKLQFTSLEVPGRFVQLLFLNPDHAMTWWWPVLLPALVGLIALVGNRPHRFVALLLIAAFVGELYISASFQTWWMRGSFGPRRLIGISAIYILGLAYLSYALVERWRFRLPRKVVVAVGVLFILWNFGLIVQYSAIRTPETRQRLDPARVVVDQFTTVPAKLIELPQKFFFERDKYYKKT